ncbi:MAG TPA: HsdR family type I site-specific deoxyribonuclease, partial [Euryarchaeota archaeon]|nr:HsdR family type I site-specific deoxyribonuclease [Euryarchaeota archaeon]
FYRVEMGEATKVIARYMQYRASEKIVQRVLNNLEGIEDKKKGLIWHWQGSGKTLTMIFAANKLYHQKQLENPTIFFIVDRNELEDQLRGEFFSLDIIEPEIIGSINELKRVLEYDDGRGKRGILITLIHKFRPDELRDFQIELEEQSKKKETIQNRKNVIAFIDEGHRTQYGTLAGQMKSILKNSFFFALTGTPISKEGRDTYKEYSYPPEETYLDRYFITDSIKDGFTVKIAYQPRLEKEVHLKKEMLDVFLSVGLEEIPVDIKDEVEERVKKKLNHINMFLEDEKRIQIVARDIAKHFKENVDGKFKAMVVTATRKACARYKSALDSYLPENYSEIVMSYNKKKDQEIIQLAVREARGRYGDEDYDDIKKGVVGRFKEEEYPKILIVTEMLLAGFDAPVLQTMYLDKPLKEHRLLQAIARTNRPYKDVKEAGLIIDYVGILKEIKKAFEKYGREYRGVIDDFESLKREFIDLINEIMELLQDVPKDQYDRETLLKAVAVLTTNEDDTRKFLENYRTLRKLFELLGPSEIKIELLSEYRWISAIYTYYMKTVRSETDSEKYIQKYFEKTVRYVHETIEFETLEKNLPIIEFNEEYLKNLQEKIESKEEKAANIVFTLNRYVLVEKHDNPIYETLTDKIERILELWKQKTKDFEQIYLEGYGAIEELNRLGRRQKELGFTNMEYSLLLALEDRFGKEEELVEDVRQLSKKLEKYMFTGWTVQPTERKKVQQAVRRFIRRYIRRYGLTHTGLNELYDKLIKNVENYGRKK